MSIVKRLKANYGDFQVDISDWQLPQKGVTALWGPSGSGKSSVLRLLLGIDEADELVWEFPEGDKVLDLGRTSVRERRLGVVFQNYELFDHMTARENLDFALEAAKQRCLSQGEKFDETYFLGNLERAVKALGVGQILDRPVTVLSGGEKQRVALARALVGAPRMLFLDEPFSALDAANRAEARKLVREVLEATGIPALIVTHDQEDIVALGASVFKIANGAIARGNIV